MKKWSVLLAVALCLAGCSKNDSPDPETEKQNDIYVFQSIQYHYDESAGDKVETKKVSLSADDFINDTSEPMPVKIYERELSENVHFYPTSDDIPYDLRIDEETAFIYVPERLVGEDWFSSKPEKVLFDLNGEYVFPATSKGYVEFTLPPYSGVSREISYAYDELTCSYIATFVGEKTGHVCEVTGKCVSMRIHSYWFVNNEIPIE